MTIDYFLNLLTQIVFLGIAGITSLNWVTNRARENQDIALVFLSLALAIIAQDSQSLLPSAASLLAIVFFIALLTQPYFLLRVARNFRPIPIRIQQVALIGLIIVALSLLLSESVPVLVIILFIAYFATVEIYASLHLIQGAMTIPGITGKRLRFASLGSGLLALVFITAFALVLFVLITKKNELPTTTQSVVGSVIQIFALLSGLAYYFGFSPPRWLRQYWQLDELPNFMRQISNKNNNRRSAIFDELLSGAIRTVGAKAALIAYSDPDGHNLRIDIPGKQNRKIENLEADCPALGRIWAQQKAAVVNLPVNMPQELLDWTKQVQAQTLFSIPIKSPVQSWGLLIVAISYAPLFSQDDLGMLNLLVERSVIPLDYSILVDNALNASEERFTKAFQSSPVAMTITRVNDDKVVDINLAWSGLFGYSREEAIDKTSVELGVTTTETRQKMMTEIKEKGVVRNIEAIVLNRLGKERNVFLSMEAITLNEEPCAITTMVDITDRKEAERKSVYQAYLLENVNDAVMSSDLNSVITFWNHGAERMFGWQAEEVVGHAGPQILRSQFTDTDRESVIKTLADLGQWKGEATQFHKDGSPIAVEISTITLYDDQKHAVGYVTVSRDITERRQAVLALQENESNARSLLRLSKQLEQANSYSEALLAALAEVKNVIGYQNVWIYLLSENKQELRLLTTTGTLSETIMDDFPTLTITGDPFLEEIFSGSDIVLVEDARTDPRTNKEIIAQLGNRTIVNVPIMLLDKHLGAFGTGSFGEEGVKIPTPLQLEYLQTLASHLAITFDRIHLVDQRKQTEKTLKNSEERFRLIVETAPVAMIVVDRNGNINLVNRQAQTLFGYSREELLGHTIEMLVPEPNKKLHIDLRKDFQAKPVSRVMGAGRDLFGIHKKGKEIPVEIGLTPYETSDGTFTLALIVDITERKHAEDVLQKAHQELERLVEERTAALSEANALLQTMMDNTPDHIYFKDANSRFIRNSRSQAIMMGLKDSHEVIGKSDFDFFPKDHAQRSFEEEKEVMNGKPLDIEERVVWPDGRITWVSTMKQPLRDANDDVIGTFGISRDITTRKHIEEELKKSNDQLEAANKELEAFSYSVSHDLRAPLRTIDGFSQAVLEDYGDKLPGEGRNHLERVRKAAQHMAELIDDLLNLSRVTRATMTTEDVNLSELAETILKNLQETQPERKVNFTITPSFIVRGDSHLLRVVLENLLNNAWKFTSKLTQAEIEFGARQEQDQIVYFVRDNGAGFDMTYASKLFGAFQRLHSMNDFPGTGIGLATVQRVINRHGGRIWAESAVNQGTTFYFTLQ